MQLDHPRALPSERKKATPVMVVGTFFLLLTLLIVSFSIQDTFNINPTSDLYIYNLLYNSADFFELSDFVSNMPYEPLFLVFVKGFSAIGLSLSVFLMTLSVFFYLSLYKLFLRFAPGWYTTMGILLVVSIYFPFNYSLNQIVIRQGWAVCFLFYALTFLFNHINSKGKEKIKNFVLFLIFGILAVLFHYSALVVLVLAFVSVRLKIKHMVVIWVLTAISYVVDHIGLQGILRAYLYPLVEANSSLRVDISTYQIGFKLNFFLLSAIPFLLWWIASRRGVASQRFNQILSVYLAVNAFSMLLSLMPYHDRFFTYGWVLIPIVMASFVYEMGYVHRARMMAKA